MNLSNNMKLIMVFFLLANMINTRLLFNFSAPIEKGNASQVEDFVAPVPSLLTTKKLEAASQILPLKFRKFRKSLKILKLVSLFFLVPKKEISHQKFSP